MSERDPKVVEAELGYHVAVTPWVENHSQRSDGRITDIGYDPERHYQRIDEAYTPPKPIPPWVPGRLMAYGYYRKLCQHLGRQQAKALVSNYLDTPAYQGANTSIAEEVERRFEIGETTSLLVDHLEEGDLRDLVIATSALIVAIGNKKLRDNTTAVFGLNIARQAHLGKGIVDRVTKTMGILWVMQDTDSLKALDVPEEAIKIAGQAAEKAFGGLTERSCLIAEVPSGTAMRLVRDNHGNPIKYERLTVRGAVASLMELDNHLPVAMYQGRSRSGPMELSNGKEELTRKEKIEKVARALASLAKNDAILTGLPVEYEDLKSKGSIKVAKPLYLVRV